MLSQPLNPQKKFSGNQIAVFSFFFGPFASVYFLKKNFDVMGDALNAQKTLLIGLGVVLALFLAFPFLPDSIPAVVYSVAYAIGSRQFYLSMQESALADYARESNWKALGIGLLSTLISAILLIAIVIIYAQIGWMEIDF